MRSPRPEPAELPTAPPPRPVACRHAVCAAEVIVVENPRGKALALDARTFWQPDVPAAVAWRIVDGLKGKRRAVRDGTAEALSVYVAHYFTCPGADARGVSAPALLQRREEYRRSALHE